MTLMVTRYALFAFGSAYVTSLHILAETGQTISFCLKTQNVIMLPILNKHASFSGHKPHSKQVFAFHAIEPYSSLKTNRSKLRLN